MIKREHGGRRALALAVALLCLAGLGTASGEGGSMNGMLGDINLDGHTNVLDVQAGVTQALGAASQTPEGDVDGSGAVNIFDVQHLVNSTLGVGGLSQRVTGVVSGSGTGIRSQLRVIAVSREGQLEEAEVDPDTGAFQLTLRVQTNWALALCTGEQGQQQHQCLGAFEFPIGESVSCTLPLPSLSRGIDLDIGAVSQNQYRLRCGMGIRQMLGQLGAPIDSSDGNSNGVPDSVEPLMCRVRTAQGVPNTADVDALLEEMAACIAAWIEEYPSPDLTDTDGNGIPDSLDPLMDCLEAAIGDWLAEQGIAVPDTDDDGNGIPDFVEAIIAHVEQGIPAWLLTLGRPDLVDENQDGVPDYIEHHLSIAGMPSYVDKDGNGIPDFAEDFDGDGIPNIADEDWAVCPGDCDGDCILDDEDVDDDNDGVPDYADDAPSGS